MAAGLSFAEVHTAHTMKPIINTATEVIIISTGRMRNPDFLAGTTAVLRCTPFCGRPVCTGLAVADKVPVLRAGGGEAAPGLVLFVPGFRAKSLPVFNARLYPF